MESELINFHQHDGLLKKSIIGQLIIVVAFILNFFGFYLQEYHYAIDEYEFEMSFIQYILSSAFYIFVFNFMGPVMCALYGVKRLKSKNYTHHRELYLLIDILCSILFVFPGMAGIYELNIYYYFTLCTIIPLIIGYYLSIKSESRLKQLKYEKEKRVLDQKEQELKMQYESKINKLKQFLENSNNFSINDIIDLTHLKKEEIYAFLIQNYGSTDGLRINGQEIVISSKENAESFIKKLDSLYELWHQKETTQVGKI
jgi:hypothetical protein